MCYTDPTGVIPHLPQSSKTRAATSTAPLPLAATPAWARFTRLQRTATRRRFCTALPVGLTVRIPSQASPLALTATSTAPRIVGELTVLAPSFVVLPPVTFPPFTSFREVRWQ